MTPLMVFTRLWSSNVKLTDMLSLMFQMLIAFQHARHPRRVGSVHFVWLRSLINSSFAFPRAQTQTSSNVLPLDLHADSLEYRKCLFYSQNQLDARGVNPL